MEPSTMVIASDNALIWRPLRSLLSGAGVLAEHVQRGNALVGFLEVRQPAVVALDLLDLGVSQVPVEVEATCAQFVGTAMDCRVLLLCEQVDSECIGHLARHGVRGVFTPDMALESFTKAVRKLIEGEVWFSRSQLGAVIGELGRPEAGEDLQWRGPSKSPTGRETEVLRIMAAGCDQRQMAARLGVSQHTVRTHIRNVMGKLGVHNRTDAVRVAIEMGIIGPATDPGTD